ncbi:MAG: hypothetical protein IJQ81_00330 [Oscillibacter sp.]|nr:hypothetical protein [Oscillibacter sp.]
MRQLLACLALIGILVKAEIVYPQAMKVHSVEKGEDKNYTVTLCSSAGFFYDTVTDLDDITPGEMMAVLMYDSMTPGDILDDTVIAMRHTGFFEK